MKKLYFIIVIIMSFHVICFANTNYLVEINGNKYTEHQFKTWWHYWKSENTPFPNDLQPFIDWILLSDEAKSLGLDKEESYKKKLLIFKEVRSLLQLRFDEVEKKMDINPDKLWDFYEKNYAPIYKIKVIVSDNLKEMKELLKKIESDKDFLKYFDIYKIQHKTKDLNWQRPINIPEEFKAKVLNSKKGDILGIINYKNSYFILFIEDKFDATKEDYQKIHKSVAVKYKKIQEAKLTEDLLNRLKKKYNIFVNWKIINEIKPFTKLSKELKNKVVIKIDSKELKAEQFQKSLEKDIKLRIRNKKISEERLLNFKKNIVASSINQTLTSIEALNRHYENTVMKDIYWFYKRNRLIHELENKIIIPNPNIKVTDKEVKEYYEKNKENFTKPDIVEIAVIQTKDKKLITAAYKRIKNGEDFFEVAREIQFHGALPEKRRVDNLVKEVRETVNKMREGSISRIVSYKDWYFIIKLIKREKKQVHKFEKVKESIKKMLYKEKIEQAKNEYLEKLRSKSKVSINKNLWQKIKEKMREDK